MRAIESEVEQLRLQHHGLVDLSHAIEPGMITYRGLPAPIVCDYGAALVGIDSLNIDSTADGERPVHTTLLGAGIPIVEHMRGLERLAPTGFRFSAVPVKVKGMGSFPVRAYAILEPTSTNETNASGPGLP